MKSNNWIWVLVAGLAVGFIIGRELPRSGSEGSSSPSASAEKEVAVAGGDKAGPSTIPSDWITEADLKATDQFAGLTPSQRFQALKVLNETPCDCGCPHGSVAKCKKEDPGCPRGPAWITQAVAMAKQGKTASEIAAAVKQAKPAAPQQPPAAGPQKVQLAAWTPIEGPKFAKVTIVEFSDFQ